MPTNSCSCCTAWLRQTSLFMTREEEIEMDTIIFLEEDIEVEEQMAREMSMDNPEDNTGSYNINTTTSYRFILP